MDAKWKFAARHSAKSATGFARLLARNPVFAMELFRKRLAYFRSRSFVGEIKTPDGFIIDTKDTLIAYWSMFVEQELRDDRWVQAVAAEPEPLAVDVGANAGVFSHYVHCVNPRAQIVAFEPLPAMVNRIRAMQQRTGMRLVCHEQAVSRQPGESWFESPHGTDGISRLSTGEGTGNRFKVTTTTLDDVLKDRHVTVMKIDVEGFEAEVIAGGQRVLANTDFVIIESEDAAHLNAITVGLGPKWDRHRLASTDYLFIRRKS
jgi:FkbM family methyltransferase